MAEQISIQDSGDDRAILSAAADIDGAAEQLLTGQSPQTTPAELIDPRAGWERIPKLVRPFVLPLIPREMADTWSDDSIREWAGTAVEAFPDHKGLPPMVAFACSSVGLVAPVLIGVKIKRAQADAIRKAREQGAAGGVLPENPGGIDGAQAA